MSFNDKLNQRLQTLQQQQLYRTRRLIESAQDTVLMSHGKSLINFCSNDYLGLANHPDMKQAFKNAVDQYGVGSGASQLISGHQTPHHQLEEELADFLDCEKVLLFSTGYMANLGVVSALTERRDEVFEDKLNHASLIDAALLSRAELSRYTHCDDESLSTQLTRSTAKNKFIVSDGVFSMDGDKANVTELSSLAKQHDAVLMIDDAHGIGVLGQTGKGIIEELNLSIGDDLPIFVGTFGKAFGSFGAFVAGSNALIENLINFSRSYIYTTAIPAAVAEATRTSLKLIRQGNKKRQRLQQNIKQFRQGCVERGLPLSAEPGYGQYSAIQPLIIGEAEQAVSLSNALKEAGFLISAIRPPTVPQNTSRLRITFSANHTDEQIEQLLDALSQHYVSSH